MSDVVIARNQALVDEVEANREQHRSGGVEAVGELLRITKHFLLSNGHILMRHYPELREYTGSKGGRPKTGERGEGGVTSYRTVAAAIGYDKTTIKKWIETAKAAGNTEEKFDKWVAPQVELAKDRWLRSGTKGLPAPLPDDKYQIIYADPPWKYGPAQHGKQSSQSSDLTKHYRQMELDEICELPIGEQLTRDDCLLFMWSTSPMLRKAMLVIAAWEFDYKASMVWDKVSHNVGHYVSVRHELLLICAKGTAPKVPRLVDSVYEEERTEHSRKPAYFRDLIDELYPDGNRIELFPRGALPPHWDGWGDEYAEA